MSKPVTVALVMPVRNEEAAVASTLDSVFASSRLPDEIIIADGMSTDRTVERIKAYQGRQVPIHVVENPTIYSGGGRNRGIRSTTREVILLADFGNAMDPSWIAEMVRPFEERQGVDMVAGMVRPLVTSDFEHCMAAIHYHDEYMLTRYSAAKRESLLPAEIAPGANSLAISRGIWERVGGYPEWLHRAQDKLFSRKAHCLGARVHVAWDACVAHHVRSTPRQVFRQLFSYGRGTGRSRYINRHFVKLAGFYAVLAMLGVSSMFVAAFGVVGVALLAAYYYHAGLRKVMTVDRGLKKVAYLWLTAAVLFPRDAGTLLGHLVGWSEWFFAPKYRALFRGYMEGCDRRALRLLSD